MSSPMTKTQKGFLRQNKGAVAAEYAVLMATVAIAITYGASGLGANINNVLNNLSSTISGAGGTCVGDFLTCNLIPLGPPIPLLDGETLPSPPPGKTPYKPPGGGAGA